MTAFCTGHLMRRTCVTAVLLCMVLLVCLGFIYDYKATEEELEGTPPNSYKLLEQHKEKDLSSIRLAPSACNMDNCFDYRRCPITEPLKFYLYPLPDDRAQSQAPLNNRNSLHSVLHMNGQRVDDPKTACIFIYIVCGYDEFSLHMIETAQLHNEGKNHVIWSFCNKASIIGEGQKKQDKEHNGYLLNAIFVTDAVDRRFRPGFDILAGHIVKDYSQVELSPFLPARRKYLASLASCGSARQSLFSKLPTSDMTAVYRFPVENECGQESSLLNIIKKSIFSFLILPDDDISLEQSQDLQRQLHAMLKHGVIPVVIGTRFVPPFSDVFDWSKVMITIPPGRITEVDTMLQSISDEDILAFKKNGRMLFEKYFSSVQAIADTVLGVLRTRIGLIPSPYQDNPSPSVYNDTFTPRKHDVLPTDSKSEENLGPFPVRLKASREFKSNLTVNFLRKYDAWNTHYQPFKLYPSTPWDGSLSGFTDRPTVSEASTHHSPYEGMQPDEQFTIVMPTYQRETVIMKTLQRLYPLPYLSKIVVVWNDPDPPPENLTWPDIKVPLEIIRTERNSLNNRFLPFDTIETEAVMSLDDDSPLEPEDIVFGFSVWLENKDRIVGYPARLHRWNSDRKTWYYEARDDCKISLVLTSAAFFHKIYMYKYTYEMPSVIRDKVDELMNCEDIAMNFLISHVTQKPPIKVTARRNFDCKGCKSALSQAAEHYVKRSGCFAFLEEVYGYMPLHYTVSRMDSIYYNTGEFKHSGPPCFRNV